MNVSAEHRRSARRFRRAAKARQAALRSGRTARKSGLPRQLLGMAFWRAVLWALAFVPFPTGWVFAMLGATVVTIMRAGQLSHRGNDEALIAMYGADDRGVLALSRRWMVSVAMWGVIDASVFLGIWYLTGRIPLALAILGVPCFALAIVVSARLFAYLIPPAVLTLLSGFGMAAIFAGAVVFNHIDPSAEFGATLVWLMGALTPCGWVLLMLHEVIDGQLLLLGLIPVLVAGALLVRSIAKIQDARLLAFAEGKYEPAPLELPEDSDEVWAETGEWKSLSRNLADLRCLPVLDYPQLDMPDSRGLLRPIVWTISVVMIATILLKFEALDGFRYFVFIAALLVGHVRWVPVFGSPAWMADAFLSSNRVVAAFTLFPVSLRDLLKTEAWRNLRKAAYAAIPLAALTATAFLAGFPMTPLGALSAGTIVTTYVLLKLPLRWCHLATAPQYKRPWGSATVCRTVFTFLLAAVWLCEFLAIMTFGVILATEEGGNYLLVGLIVVALGLLNAILAGIWTLVSLSFYGRRLLDLVRPPPNS